MSCPAPNMPPERLRFQVLAGNAGSKDWQAACLQKLRRVGAVDVVSGQDSGGAPVDFILCFGDLEQGRQFLDAARYGVWAFNIGDWENFRGGPGGYWEVYEGSPTTSALLVRLTRDPDVVEVLRQGCLRTKRASFRTNIEHVLSRITHWPAQVCTDIHNGVFGLEMPTLRAMRPPRKAPTRLQDAIMAARTARSALQGGMREMFCHDQWNVGVVRRPIQDFLRPLERPRVEWLPAPRAPREFLADPFGVIRDGKLTIICECFNHADGLGEIVAVDPSSGQFTTVRVGPEKRIHLSFPYIFEHEGRLLCVPEMHQANEVALYEVERYPDRWVKRAVLLPRTSLVDVTVFFHEGRWWLAGSDPGLTAPSADLSLWYADAPEGPWIAHSGNPVKTDVRSARSAGSPFVVDGVLYRPAMDETRTYGGRVQINRVKTLTPVAFSEEVAAVVEPDPRGPYAKGLHTLSAVGDLTLIDGKRTVFVYEQFARSLGDRLGKLLRNREGHPVHE